MPAGDPEGVPGEAAYTDDSARVRGSRVTVEGRGSPDRGSAHLRFGLGADLAALGAPDILGLGVGVQARLGLQFSPWFAIYYQPHAIGALAASGDANGAVFGTVFNSVNAELDFPVLQLGLGPSLDLIWRTDCEIGAAGCGTATGSYLGVDTRAALLIGPHGRGSHAGLALEANLHPTFVGDTVLTTFTLGFAGEIY